jgi:cellulose synthase/poly-beta-1,6-N-acetylglucosamine synthase-like glycosyltransferase
MERHSMFFQGNDVEVGLLGDRMGYRVGHVAYEVATEVPDRLEPWWRQRYAWSGGEWRLAITNVKFAVFHPFFFFYATIVMIAMCPFRWYSLIVSPWVLLLMYALYLVLISILVWRSWTWLCLLYPLYTLVNSLIMVPLGAVSYVQMSVQHHNWGRIRFNPGPAVRRVRTSA